MFEHYSEHARNVIERARQEAQKLRHDHIGTEHLLLGLIEVKDGCAAMVLRHRKIDLPHARQQVEKLVEHDSGPEDGCYEKLPFTQHSLNAMNDALNEARQLKHPTVGSEHLLLGLLYENEGTGAKALRELGFKLDDIRKDVLYFIEQEHDVN